MKLEFATLIMERLDEKREELASVVLKTNSKTRFLNGMCELYNAVKTLDTSGYKSRFTRELCEKQMENYTGYLLEKGFVGGNGVYKYEWYLHESFDGREFKPECVELFINGIFIEREAVWPIIEFYLKEREEELNAEKDDENEDTTFFEPVIDSELQTEILEEIVEDSYKRVESYEKRKKSPKYGVFRHDFISSLYGGLSKRELLEYVEKSNLSDSEYALLLLDIHMDRVSKLFEGEAQTLTNGIKELLRMYEFIHSEPALVV